jgi:hypothetical protein
VARKSCRLIAGKATFVVFAFNPSASSAGESEPGRLSAGVINSSDGAAIGGLFAAMSGCQSGGDGRNH